MARVPPPPPPERARRFLILPFRNVSRGADQEWLVEGATTMLADGLARWREISVVPDERLYPALRRYGLAPGAVMDLPRVRRLAEETGGWTAVVGEVLATGGRLRVSARAYDVVTGRELVRADEEVPVDCLRFSTGCSTGLSTEFSTGPPSPPQGFACLGVRRRG